MAICLDDSFSHVVNEERKICLVAIDLTYTKRYNAYKEDFLKALIRWGNQLVSPVWPKKLIERLLVRGSEYTLWPNWPVEPMSIQAHVVLLTSSLFQYVHDYSLSYLSKTLVILNTLILSLRLKYTDRSPERCLIGSSCYIKRNA